MSPLAKAFLVGNLVAVGMAVAWCSLVMELLGDRRAYTAHDRMRELAKRRPF